MAARADYEREYRLAYEGVMEAHRQGYHKPYANLHSDDAEWQGYEDGFRTACRDIARDAVLEEAARELPMREPDEVAAGGPANWSDFVQVAQDTIRSLKAGQS